MKTLQHFMLPEQTNQLYKKEAISSISLTRDIADKINELVDAYNAVANWNLAKHQEQDGAIRKGIIYMKDNLINTLHDLLELLTEQGFFDERVKVYTKELEKRIDTLLSSITEGITSLDAELIDIRSGADNNIFGTAGAAVRSQIAALLQLASNENLIAATPRNRGYYTINDAGGEYLVTDDGLALTGRDEIYTDLIEVEPKTEYTLSYIGDKNFISDDLWLSVHFYDSAKKYVTREYTALPGEFIKMTFNSGTHKYIRISCRLYSLGHIKLEKGFFSTLRGFNEFSAANILDGYPLNHKAFYSWSKDGLMHSFAATENNQERSTDLIPCSGKKKMTVFYKYGLDGWMALNFLTKDGYFALLNESSEEWKTDINSGIDESVNIVLRRTFNTTGIYEIDIPEDAYAVGISTRTANLEHIGIFFDDEESYSRKYYELLFDSFKTAEIISTGNGDIPQTVPYEIKDIAHRGFSSAAPENTLPAYTLAAEKGFKYVECDVLFTSDNVAVLLHDNSIDRTSDGTGYIAELTYNAAAAYDFGSWFSSTYAGTKLPTFEEFISLCRKLSLHPYIEIKGDTTITTEQLDILIATVKKYGMIKNVTWICFEYSNLEYIVSQVNTARVGYTVSTLSNSIVDMTKALKTGYNEVFVDTNAYVDSSMQYAIDNNIPVERYTIDDSATILSQHPYISGVTSNAVLASEILKNSVV